MTQAASLAAREQQVDDRRHVVVVHARAEKRELRAGVDVSRGELLEMRNDLGLGERRLELECTVEAHRCRDVAEELLDGGDADRREHLLAVALGQREVRMAHLSASSFR